MLFRDRVHDRNFHSALPTGKRTARNWLIPSVSPHRLLIELSDVTTDLPLVHIASPFGKLALTLGTERKCIEFGLLQSQRSTERSLDRSHRDGFILSRPSQRENLKATRPSLRVKVRDSNSKPTPGNH